MNVESIQTAVTRVLFKHECAVIPGFGAFILRKNFGIANPFSSQIKPASNSIFFNADISEDDGFVANELRENLGFSFKQANSLLCDFHLHVEKSCANSQRFRMGDLGDFRLNPKGELFFLADTTLNLSLDTFGLPVISWEWKQTMEMKPSFSSAVSQIEIEQPPLTLDLVEIVKLQTGTNTPHSDSMSASNESIHHSNHTLINRKNPLLWRVAASFAIISIGAGVLLSVVQIWSVASGNELATLIPQDTQFHKVAKPQSARSIQEQPLTESTNAEQLITHTLNFGSGENALGNYHNELAKTKGKYTVNGGSYITMDLANRECLLWQKLGLDACVVAVRNSSLNKVVLKRFESEKSASEYAESIKNMPTGTLSVSEVALDWR